jgi:peptidoglycan/LPS O-acetylase OafA/YrhL
VFVHRQRLDIDGLRAIAVALVLVYHLGLVKITGGFVGVDVFFVISGYVISRMIATHVATGQPFSYGNFFVRRILRLVPALLAVTIASLLAGWYFLSGAEYVELAKSSLAANAFYSNVYFAKRAGYFMGDVFNYPLLHTWSLAVEEQFYIVAPFVLVRFMAHRHWRWILATFGLVSLAFALRASWYSMGEGYYLTHYRAFELILGVALGTRVIAPVLSFVQAQWVSGVGLLLIGLSAVTLSGESPFPGPMALLPCLGAMCVILGGEAAPGDRIAWVNQVLAWRPFAAVGQLSYSLYLWHWPVLVFARYALDRPPSWIESVGLLALIVVVSVGSYRWIEQPARRAAAPLSRGLFAAGSAAGVTLVVAAACGGLIFSNGAPQRLPAYVALLEAKLATAAPSAPACLAGNYRSGCVVGAAAPAVPSFVVWGDSHALALARVISVQAQASNLRGIMLGKGGCPPLLGDGWTNARDTATCHDSAAHFKATLAANPDVQRVVLVARWSLYGEGLSPTEYGTRRTGTRLHADLETGRRMFVASLEHTVGELTRLGKRVTIIGPVPDLGLNVAKLAVRAAINGRPFEFTFSKATFDQQQQRILGVIARVGRMPGVEVLNPHDILCSDGVTCQVFLNGAPIYADDDHLNDVGGGVIAPLLTKAISPHATTK